MPKGQFNLCNPRVIGLALDIVGLLWLEEQRAALSISDVRKSRGPGR
jgi:hypothetical protein